MSFFFVFSCWNIACGFHDSGIVMECFRFGKSRFYCGQGEEVTGEDKKSSEVEW